MCRSALTSALIVLLVFSYFTSVPAGEFYKWTDEDGTVHYSDSPVDIPDSSMGKGESTNSQSKEAPLKKGWNQNNLSQTIIGCTYGMVDPNLESYRKRALDNGNQVTDDEMEKVKNILFPICNKTCKCVIEKVSRKWSFEKFNRNANSSEHQQYIKYLITNKVCPLPVPPQ